MRRFMVLLTVLGLAGAAALLGVSSAGAVPAPKTVTIKKVAVNAPPGTKFTIHVACNTSEIFVPGGGGTTTDELDFTFTVNEAGEAVPDGTNTVTFEGNTPCSVTETASGGATTTSYECADNLGDFTSGTGAVEPGADGSAPDAGASAPAPVEPGPFCLSSGPQADPINFEINMSGEVVTVTVTNTFAAPAAAAAAVEAPVTFTG